MLPWEGDRKIVRMRSAALLFVLVLLALGAQRTSAAPLELVSAADAQNIELGADEGGWRTSRLSVIVRNASAKPVTLSLRYLREDASAPLAIVPGRAAEDAVATLVRPFDLELEGGAVQQLALRFRLGAHVDASALDGALVVRAVPQQTPAPTTPPAPAPDPAPPTAPTCVCTPCGCTTVSPPPDPPGAAARDEEDAEQPTPLVVRVVGTVAGPRGVSIEPAKVTLHVRRGWSGGEGSAEIALRGAEAAAVLKRAEGLTGKTLLRNDDGNDARVQWAVRDGKAYVEVKEKPSPGAYEGTLALLDGAPDPHVSIAIESRDMWLWPLALVALGAWAGSLLPMLGAVARRRALIRAALKEGILTYRLERPGWPVPPTWLDRILGTDPAPWSARTWTAMPYGAAGLFSELRWARNRGDLDEAARTAQDMLAWIGTWRAIEQARVPLETLRAEDVPPLGRRPWRDTALARKSAELLVLADRRPATPERGHALAEQLEQQLEWHASVTPAWRELAAADVSPAARPRLERRLLELCDPAPGQDQPASETLAVRLDALRREVGEAQAAYARELKAAAPKPAPAARALAFLKSIPAWLAGGDGGDGGAQAPEADVEPAAVSGDGAWARIQRIGRRLKDWFDVGPQQVPNKVAVAVQRRDWVLSTVAVLLGSAVYLIEIYDDTFGSPDDYAKAFLAGFGAQAVVRWAALPIAESFRLGGKPAEEGAPAPAGPAGKLKDQ